MLLFKKKLVTIVLFTVAISTLSGCDKINKGEPKNFSYGVISTTGQEIDTDIIRLDSELKVLDTTNYDVCSVGGGHFCKPVVLNNYMYDISEGDSEGNQRSKVIGLDLSNNQYSEYEFTGSRITDIKVTNQYIYAISNLDGDTCIERYALDSKKIDKMELKGILAMKMCRYENDIYFFGHKNEKFIMYKVDITNHKVDEVYDLTNKCDGYNEPAYYEIYNNKLYMPYDNQLLELSLDNYSLREIQLPYREAFALQVKENLLYIRCGDIFDENAKTNIVAYNMDTNKIEKQYEFDFNVIQFILEENKMIALSFDDILYQFDMVSDKECKLVTKTKIQRKDNHYLSALFGKYE